MFRKKRRRKRPLEDAHSYLSPRRAFVLVVYVVAEDVAVAVDFEEGEEDEEKREEEEEARTFVVSMWISMKGRGRGDISRQNESAIFSCRPFDFVSFEHQKKKKNLVFPPFEPFGSRVFAVKNY